MHRKFHYIKIIYILRRVPIVLKLIFTKLKEAYNIFDKLVLVMIFLGEGLGCSRSPSYGPGNLTLYSIHHKR